LFAEHRYDGVFKGHLVVPIPLSRSKASQRGFNQAELIASEVARYFCLKKEKSILIRTKDTKSQFGLTRVQRYKNLSHSFDVPKHMVTRTKNSSILLVDDICTSGATFKSASEALYGAGVKKVRCFSLAKAVYNK
jgi:ComF family protein